MATLVALIRQRILLQSARTAASHLKSKDINNVTYPLLFENVM